MRIGVLTGGGDCPGLNAVIRAVGPQGRGRATATTSSASATAGAGVIDGETIELTDRERPAASCRGAARSSGRAATNPFKTDDGVAQVLDTLRREHDRRADRHRRRGHARRRGEARRARASTSSACPKTIDNDLSATEVTFGFDTAVQIATDAIDRLHTTAESHDRVMVVEVMGRHAGWIALHSGLAGGADIILIPELPFDIDEVCERHRSTATARGANFSIVVVAEGATPVEGTMTLQSGETDEFGHVRLGGRREPGHRGDQGAHRLRRPGHDPRPRPPRGHADRVRPRARDPLRDRGDRRGARRRVRLDGRAAVRRRSCAVPIDDAVEELKLVDPACTTSPSIFFG